MSLYSDKYKKTINIENKIFDYYSLSCFQKEKILRLPFSIRVILEAAIRKYDNFVIKESDIDSILNWGKFEKEVEIPFYPSRVLLQDYTGVPCIVDLASMRTALKKTNSNFINRINPSVPVELVVDHSIQVDFYGDESSKQANENIEFERNKERFRLLKWGQQAFKNFKIVPPGSGIVHQVNLENLARLVFITDENLLYPDSVIGTDSHTTMINGLGVLGWGVGGIEAESVMLGESITMLMPKVVGVELINSMCEGICATDVVLTLTNILRKEGVVGQFVEFFGEGLSALTVQDRATLSNMAPEYGATTGFFPIDENTLDYMKNTGRDQIKIHISEKYLKENFLFRDSSSESKIEFSKKIILDLSLILPSVAGPKRPQDIKQIKLNKLDFDNSLTAKVGFSGFGLNTETINKELSYKNYILKNGSLLIAAITSCTNTSNPFVLVSAGLVARNARKLGLKVPEYVKTSLSPGSKVVSKFFENSKLKADLEYLGFYTAGYGCMTCIGNSGDLKEDLTKLIENNKEMIFASALSGNRNFEGRVHPLTKANYLCSPAYVVSYALAGRINIDFENEPIGLSPITSNSVYLRDIFPSNKEVMNIINEFITNKLYIDNYSKSFFEGNTNWKNLDVVENEGLYDFDDKSSYIKNPPYFDNLDSFPNKITAFNNLTPLVILGDSITTDHISPAGSISKKSPTAEYFSFLGINTKDYNSYGARRGNHEVMKRGTFANITIKNKMLKDVNGPYSVANQEDSPKYIFDVAKILNFENMIIIAGKEYGSGSSRDWAAKGPKLLGVRVVIAESFERIHRSNLIGMGILPLQFKDGNNSDSLGLTGFEKYSINLTSLSVKGTLIVKTNNGIEFDTLVRIDTDVELEYFKNDGILLYVFRKLLNSLKDN